MPNSGDSFELIEFIAAMIGATTRLNLCYLAMIIELLWR